MSTKLSGLRVSFVRRVSNFLLLFNIFSSVDASNSNDASNGSGTINSGYGNNTKIVSNSRNNRSNIKDDSNSWIVRKAACNSRAPTTAMLRQHQCSCNSGAPATAVPLQQRCPCNSGAPATAVPLQQQGSCNSNAPGTSVLLQQRFPCNSRAPATAGLLLQSNTCNIRKLNSRRNNSSNRRMSVTVGQLTRPPARACRAFERARLL